MTINLFRVDEALDAEDKQQKRLEKALVWKLRRWEKKPEEPTASEGGEEDGVPPEVH